MTNTATIQNGRASSQPTPDENPIAVFEGRARQIISSSLASEVKAQRLGDLSEAIGRYVARLNVHLASSSMDSWSAMTAHRMRIYLIQLGDDVRKLSSKTRMN